MFSKILLLFGTLNLVLAFTPEFQLFSGKNLTGTSVIFKEKLPTMVEWAHFANTAQSYCVLGWWSGYTKMDYIGTKAFNRLAPTTKSCYERSFLDINSIRYHGSEDTSTQEISFFNGTATDPFSGKEVIVTSPALNQFGFLPTYATSQGNSNWTLYPYENFVGNSTCFMNKNSHGWTEITLVNLPVLSVIKGCDTRPIDNYVYGDDANM